MTELYLSNVFSIARLENVGGSVAHLLHFSWPRSSARFIGRKCAAD